MRHNGAHPASHDETGHVFELQFRDYRYDERRSLFSISIADIVAVCTQLGLFAYRQGDLFREGCVEVCSGLVCTWAMDFDTSTSAIESKKGH